MVMSAGELTEVPMQLATMAVPGAKLSQQPYSWEIFWKPKYPIKKTYVLNWWPQCPDSPRFCPLACESHFFHYRVKPRLNLLKVSEAESAVTLPNAEHVIHAKYQLNSLLATILFYICCLSCTYFPYSSDITLLNSQCLTLTKIKSTHILLSIPPPPINTIRQVQ